MEAFLSGAVRHYNQLLSDESALVEELRDRFFDRMREAKLTFGGRVLCPFLRPNFISPALYGQIQEVSARIFRAIETVEARLGPELWDRVDLRPEERELVAIDPGYRRSAPTARLDSFVTPKAYQFVELNAETPAGIAYNDVLVDIFLDLPLIKRFQERYALRRFHARDRLLETLLACYREAGGRSPRPTIAIVDFEEVPTRTEHFLFRDFFASRGYPSMVVDPRHLRYENRRLGFEGQTIDIVYKRLLTNEFLQEASRLGALFEAAKQKAVILVNPFRCKPIHKKAIFAVLTDEDTRALLGEDEQAAVAAHIPWTRRVREGFTLHHGQRVDLPAFIQAHQNELVMKPNDDYGGKGVFIGWELSSAEWDKALAQALCSSYVVQEKVELQRESFPVLEPDLAFHDLVVDLDPFLFNGAVEGLLTRLSSTSLANVTSGGGQVPALMVEPR